MKHLPWIGTTEFLLALFVGAPSGVAQTRNEKILHNTQHTSASLRVSANAGDTIYAMEPALSRTGYGGARGFRVVLQDQDYNTAETVQFGFVRYASNKSSPDVSAGGLIFNGGLSLKFPKPATGVVSAAMWTITLGQPVVLPKNHGIRLVLPVPPKAADGIGVHAQRGNTSRVPAALQKQGTFSLSSAGAAVAFFEKATTLHAGAFYVEPVTQMYVRSSAYGTSEDLLGLEALHPNATGGDKIGFLMTGDAFASQVALLMISGGLRASPITTPIGSLFLNPPTGAIQLPFVLDATGKAKSPAVAIPAKLKIWSQTAFLDLKKSVVRLSDATGIEAQ